MQEKLMKASQQLKEGKKHSGDSDHVQDVSSGGDSDDHQDQVEHNKK
jgi:hypothetical protein